MPTISSARCRPHTGRRVFVCPGISCRRATVLILMAAIAMPVVLVRPDAAEARSTTSIPAPPAAAASEPFVLTRPQRRTAASVLSGVVGTIGGLVETPAIPAGFESAKLPTHTERLRRYLQPVAALFATTRRAVPDPALGFEPAPPPPSGTVLFDFDGDGRADIGRWHSSNTEFKVRNSGNASYSSHTIGSSTAVPAPGDFDADGKTDATVFNAGSWTIRRSSNGSTQNISFGTTGDVPVAADYS